MDLNADTGNSLLLNETATNIVGVIHYCITPNKDTNNINPLFFLCEEHTS